MIFDDICAIIMMVIMIIIRFHVLFEYENVIVFIGDLIINLCIVVHEHIMIIVIVDILFKLDHFCLRFGVSEIMYRNIIIIPPI